MIVSRESMDDNLRQSLVEYCYDIIGCMHDTYRELAPGMPESIYQESLLIALHQAGYKDAEREYHHYPIFRGVRLDSHMQLDILVPKQGRNIVVECKSITKLGNKERLQLFGYLRGTEFPVGILVNFGSYPKAEIERYYYNHKTNTVYAF